MSMSKKDFIALADTIKAHSPRVIFSADHLEVLVRFCREQNPRFMSGRWNDYINGRCGSNGGKIKTPKAAKKTSLPSLGACSCKRGIERDNCANCEGTGKRIDFAALRARQS